MSFSADLKKASIAIINESNEMRQAIIIELFSSIILDTPVDEGRARGNWQTTANEPATGEIERLDKKGDVTVAEVVNVVSTSASDGTLYLANNLEYIEPLENGHSGQAPAGMVRKNIARIDQILKEKAST